MYRVDEKTFAGVFALVFLIGVFVITGMFVFRWLYTGEPEIIDYVKTFWAIIGPLLGAILTYYFKS